jgi:tetratricopeptide (TPR) repeat protein
LVKIDVWRWRLERIEEGPRWALPSAVGVVALVVRLWVLLDQRGGNPLFRLAILDDRQYLELAAAVTEGAPGQPWFLAPLFPWVLGTVSSLIGPGMLGPGMLAASLVNVAAGTLTAVVAALAARDLHSHAAGWLAGALVALAGTFVFHDVLPGQEPLLCLLHVAGAWAAVRWLRSGSPAAAGLMGLAAGVAAMGRATSLVVAAAAALLAVAQLRSFRRLLPGVAALALGLAVVLVPAALRNQSVAGDLTPFPWSGGVNLYVANGPDARAETAFVARELGFSPADMEVNARRIAEEAAGGPLSPGEISSYWTSRTWDESGGLGELLPHGLRKAALFWAASEYGSNHYVAAERRFALWLRIVPVSEWWLLALGVGGWWVARRRRPSLDVLAVTIVLTWGALTIVYPVSRYRLPVVPLAGILAACGAVELLRPDARRGRLVALGLAVACSGVALGHGVVRPPPNAAPSYTNLGTALLREGRAETAEHVLRDGLSGWPDDGPARLALGRALARQGRHAEALEEFALAEKDERTQWAAGVPAVRALVETGAVQRAEAVGEMLSRELPPDPVLRAELLAWWALAAGARGDHGTATQRLEEARRLAPGHEAVIEVARTLSGRRHE